MRDLIGKLSWTAYTALHVRGEASLPFRPLEEVQHAQQRRLHALVRHAFETVPFYCEEMRKRGLKPADIRTAKDLALLPLVSPDQFADETERFHTRDYARLTSLELNSSGTTGRTKVIGYDKKAMFLALTHGHRQRVVLRHFTGRIAGYREAILVRMGGPHTQVRSYYERNSWFPRRLELDRLYLPPGPDLDGAIDRLNEFKPQVLRGYGSSLAALFLSAARKGREVTRPAVIVYGADRMMPEERAFIETEFGIPVISTYQSAEALRIGFECEQRNGFHISLDHTAVRIAGPDGGTVPPGETGEVVISNLVNRATVVLNYRLGDVAALEPKPCPCGRSLPLLKGVEGRSDDLVWLENGGAIHAVQISSALQKTPGVRRVQLVQKGYRDFEIRVVRLQGAEPKELEALLVQELQRALGLRVRASVTYWERIPAEASGKTRSVISNVGVSRAR